MPLDFADPANRRTDSGRDADASWMEPAGRLLDPAARAPSRGELAEGGFADVTTSSLWEVRRRYVDYLAADCPPARWSSGTAGPPGEVADERP